jgi:hypothetical protein
MNRFAPSEGSFGFFLGIVIIATRPDRFWLGFSLAVIPVLVGVLGKARGDRARPGS